MVIFGKCSHSSLKCQPLSNKMILQPKNIQLLILILTSVVVSRTVLISLEDPEGPNLLVVGFVAMFIYLASLVLLVNRFVSEVRQKVLLLILMQVVIGIVLYYCLR